MTSPDGSSVSSSGRGFGRSSGRSSGTPATLRVIQWATGGVGRAAIQAVRDHPELELVGCWVHSSDKVGADAGEIADAGRLGVPATDDVEAILATEADCVV